MTPTPRYVLARILCVTCLLAWSIGCGSDKSQPSAPTAPSTPVTPAPPPPAPPPPVVTIQGTVRATNDGVPIAGALVELTVAGPIADTAPAASMRTDAGGRYSLTYQRSATYMRLTVSGDGLITRNSYVEAARSREANIDVFREDVTFHLRDFQIIARSGPWGGDPIYFPLKPVTRPAVTLYMSTMTYWPLPAKPVDPGRIDFVQNVILSSIAEMTDGRVSVSGVDRGPITEPRAGYLTVLWRDFDPARTFCDEGSVSGASGDRPEISLVSRDCGCDQYQYDPGAIRHSLGHALGLQDTESVGDLMFWVMGRMPGVRGYAMCDAKATSQERRYLRYVLSRPYGNTHPDNDPQFSVLP